MTENLHWLLIALITMTLLVTLVFIGRYKKSIDENYIDIIVSESNYKLIYIPCAFLGFFIYNIIKDGMENYYFYIVIFIMVIIGLMIINFKSLIFTDHGIFENKFSKGEIKNISWHEVTRLVLVQKTSRERKRDLCCVYISKGDETIRFSSYYFKKSKTTKKIDYFYHQHGFEYIF